MADETYTVKAPNDGFTGIRAGVHFENGEGKATAEQARRLADRGYEVPGLEDEGGTDEEVDTDPLQEIDGIGSARAEQLRVLGLESPHDLADADAAEVAGALDKVDADTVADWQAQV